MNMALILIGVTQYWFSVILKQFINNNVPNLAWQAHTFPMIYDGFWTPYNFLFVYKNHYDIYNINL